MALITCVIGATTSGKSYTVQNCFRPPLWIIGSPGQMIRNSVGMYHAGEEANPNRFDLTEELVRTYVTELIGVADRVKRPLVLDGFPRDREQARWFFENFTENEIIVLVMKASGKVYFVDGDPEIKRHERSVADVADVMEVALANNYLVKEVKTPWTDF